MVNIPRDSAARVWKHRPLRSGWAARRGIGQEPPLDPRAGRSGSCAGSWLSLALVGFPWLFPAPKAKESQAGTEKSQGRPWLFACRDGGCLRGEGWETSTFVNICKHPSTGAATSAPVNDARAREARTSAARGSRGATPFEARPPAAGFQRLSTAPRAFRVSLFQSSARPRAKTRRRVAQRGPWCAYSTKQEHFKCNLRAKILRTHTTRFRPRLCQMRSVWKDARTPGPRASRRAWRRAVPKAASLDSTHHSPYLPHSPCNGGVAQSVRASACHAEGRGFEPRRSRHVSRQLP